MSKLNETAPSLKSLASGVLERLEKNKPETRCESNRVRPTVQLVGPETKRTSPQKPCLIQLSSLPDEYQERIAIAEYDGLQTSTQAERIAYLDAFVAVLVAFPHENTEGDWLSRKIVEAQKWLLDQGITQPK